MFLTETLSWVLVGLSLVSVVGSWVWSQIMFSLANKYHITDDPKSDPARKKQKQPVPLLGGTGLVLWSGFLMGLVWLMHKFNWLDLSNELGRNLEPFKLIWILLAVLILLLGGFLDDKYKLSSKYQLLFIHLAIFLAIFAGNLKIVTLSFGLPDWLVDVPGSLELLTYLWLLFCTGATKFLDGHDGLVTSVGMISFLAIASVSALPHVNQPLVFSFAIIWAGALVGFLPLNFPEARLYLGEGASWAIGFVIGALAILSGAKLATTSSVLGWFVVDLLLVWVLRLLEKRNPFFSPDRLHWHFRLVDLGMSKIAVLAFTAIVTIFSSQLILLIPTDYKLAVLIAQSVLLLGIFVVTETIKRRLIVVNKG